MKNILLFIGLCIISISAFSQDFVPGQILVQLEENVLPQDIVDDLIHSTPSLNSLRVERLLSNYMRIWLFSFDEEVITEREVLRYFDALEKVRLVQLNHWVTDRSTIPDDPEYGTQWHHEQIGDHDIDTDLAWDITTGGYTEFGDRIVVCVIEGGGSSWDHEDLIDNHWVNENEIPDNGIDDDGNGFVDDYNGWNPVDEDDVIGQGNHGTSVSSMIGSTGNNGIGVAGVNWDVGIMQVTIGSIGGVSNPNEANVIAAYDYPLKMRKLYNETGGVKGAFVVATNASWGIDFGQPSNAPMWCAMYDSLGVQGILNCGATSNSNVNVDDVGDLPTGCGSDYMVAVTATNTSDVRTFSGYGINSIDLAAPGESVYLANNGGYGFHSGTSFASPCVAGVIALMYSTPCASLMTLVNANPQAGADFIRDALFQGVDPIFNLQNEVATGGRVNAFNSIEILLNSCSTSDCLPPYSISVSYDGVDDYTLHWGAVADTLTFDMRYRLVGDLDWTVVNNIDVTEFTLVNLMWCSSYEAQFLTHCGPVDSDWSSSFLWDTDGCCTVPDAVLAVESLTTETSISVVWQDLLAATSFDLDIAPWGSSDWTTFVGVVDTSFVFLGLDTCQTYNIKIAAHCGVEVTVWSDVIVVNTNGCIDCTNLTYCDISGDGGGEWIAEVIFNTIDNTSDSDNGYGDYSDLSTTVIPGSDYDISLTPGYNAFQWTEVFKVWVDFNADEVYGDNELVFESQEPLAGGVSGMVYIPMDAILGPVGMRVSMDYSTSSGGGSLPVACGSLAFGEAEDYCIRIDNGTNVVKQQLVDWTVFPVPASESVVVSLPHNQTIVTLSLLNTLGQTVMELPIRNENITLDVQALGNGIYYLALTSSTGVYSVKPMVVNH